MDPDEKRFRERELRVERWKLLISILTSVMVAGLTWIVNNAVQERGAYLSRQNQILLEKQKIYAEMAVKLNAIYVYIKNIGDFREYQPADILKMKRAVDRQFCSYRPYWSAPTEGHYEAFMKSAFSTYQSAGKDARIRARLDVKKMEFQDRWKSEWDGSFTNDEAQDIGVEYYNLVSAILEDTVSADVRKVSRTTWPGGCPKAQ